MRPDERDVLERAIHRVTEQAANADAIVDEAMTAALDRLEGGTDAAEAADVRLRRSAT